MVRIDPYFYKQPPLAFVEELKKPIHTQKPLYFCRAKKRETEAEITGCFLQTEFPDVFGVLETAYNDFRLFMSVYEIEGEQYPIRVKYAETECFEAYRVRVEEDGCVIEAADTEGIRRGLIFLEDELNRREGPFLPLGEIVRKPHIRERITRGFFSPTNRPPKRGDELSDEIDYYPEEYLNRLAHDGTNGLWIYTRFQDLLDSDCFPEFGQGRQKRLEKLRKVIAKCKRYGIKVWVFAIEPMGLSEEMAVKYPQVQGAVVTDTLRAFCTHSELGERYCVEATNRLMTELPELGGYISITSGERITNCAPWDYSTCPNCKDYKRGDILSHTVDLLREGMRRTGTKADFVSWTYDHRFWKDEDIEDYIKSAPDDVMLMQNFEDRGYTEQLGKTREAMDYWLSYAGPSGMFEFAAKAAQKYGKHMFAKMQVCCSHELASVPYIPVPGILYDKYTRATQLGVEGVMQCWYFGNYPSLMSKAAGELSFMEENVDKDSFLQYLAAIYYGESAASDAVKAWNHFERGYVQYPVNIMFSYYGPMHDGVVWELSLLPKNQSLSRSWLLLDPPDGDRIGESLQSGHTLEEAMILTDNIRKEWEEGMRYLPGTGPEEQKYLAQALEILFASASNIVRFYSLREQLGLTAYEDAGECADDFLKERRHKLLVKMEDLVKAEMINSEKMIELCQLDLRLGYHSEAEGYKFFPEKLLHRIEGLKVLLETEFATVRERIEKGLAPLSYYLGEKQDAYIMHRGKLEDAVWQPLSDDVSAFRMACDKEKVQIEVKSNRQTNVSLTFELRLMWPSPELVLNNGCKRLGTSAGSHQSVFGEKIETELSKYQLTCVDVSQSHYIVTVDRKDVDWQEERPVKLRVAVWEGEWQTDGIWKKEEDPVCTLGKSNQSPEEYGWVF